MLNHNHSPQDYLPCLIAVGYSFSDAKEYYYLHLKSENYKKIIVKFKR